MEDWGAIAAEVAGALGEFTTVVILRDGELTGPENKPTYGPPTEHELKAVLLDYAEMERDGTLIRAQDRKILVEAGAFVPTTADAVRIKGVEVLEIVKVTPTEPAGIPVLFELQVRS